MHTGTNAYEIEPYGGIIVRADGSKHQPQPIQQIDDYTWLKALAELQSELDSRPPRPSYLAPGCSR